MTKDITITMELVKTIVEESLPKMIQDSLVDKYDSPLKKAVDQIIKDKEGEINILVKEIVAGVFTDPVFKTKVADAVIAKLVASALR